MEDENRLADPLPLTYTNIEGPIDLDNQEPSTGQTSFHSDSCSFAGVSVGTSLEHAVRPGEAKAEDEAEAGEVATADDEAAEDDGVKVDDEAQTDQLAPQTPPDPSFGWLPNALSNNQPPTRFDVLAKEASSIIFNCGLLRNPPAPEIFETARFAQLRRAGGTSDQNLYHSIATGGSSNEYDFDRAELEHQERRAPRSRSNSEADIESVLAATFDPSRTEPELLEADAPLPGSSSGESFEGVVRRPATFPLYRRRGLDLTTPRVPVLDAQELNPIVPGSQNDQHRSSSDLEAAWPADHTSATPIFRQIYTSVFELIAYILTALWNVLCCIASCQIRRRSPSPDLQD